MQIAVGAVRVMKGAGDVEVQVIAVRDPFMAAGSAMRFAALDRGARSRPFPVHFEAVLVEMVLVGRVQVPIMKVVRVVAVPHGLVAAARPVLVSVTLMFTAGHVWPPRASSHRLDAGVNHGIIFSDMRPIPVFAFVACLGTAAGRGECAPERQVAAATIAPLASLAATVAGPDWDVRTVIPPGTSPHVFEPSPRDVRRFAPARLVVTVGAGYDDWAGRLAQACASGAVLHDAGKSVGVESGDGGDHDGELGRDPHWWLSPRRAARALAPLAERFAALDPPRADGYLRRARAGVAALLALDAELAALLLPVKGATVVAAHNSWAYFTFDYGLVDGGAIETAPGREPSPRDLRKLIDLVRARRVRAVFAEPQFSSAAARMLASDAGIRVAFVDPIGGVPGRSDYADLLRYDAHAFRDALGAP